MPLNARGQRAATSHKNSHNKSMATQGAYAKAMRAGSQSPAGSRKNASGGKTGGAAIGGAGA